MKTFYSLTLILLTLASAINAQTTIVLQPDGGGGKDALIEMRNTDLSVANTNDGNIGSFEAGAWTWGGDPGAERSLIQFDLSFIPANATITDARLSLYHDPYSTLSPMHSTLSGSNESVLRRITTNWDEATVTWNTQPATDTTHQVTLPMSITGTEDYLNIDVTQLVTDMYLNQASSFGFMLQLVTEQYYRALIFASSDNTDCNLHPKLVITYQGTSPAIYFLSMKPGSGDGKDALIEMRNADLTVADNNNGNIESFEAAAWTWGGDPGLERSLLQFDLSAIPANAIVIDARLSLYNDSTSTLSSTHQTLSGSNESVLQRITSNWNESTVTWNTQPSTDTTHEVVLPMSTNPHEDYLNIDVTDLVEDMYLNPLTSFGFMIKLTTEQYYRALIFASSDHPNCNLHPKLEVKYTLTTGTENPDHSNAVINIYPNPFSGSITITSNENTQSEVILFDILSRNLLRQPFTRATTLNTEQLAKGIYIYEVRNKHGVVQTGKLVKE